MNKDLLKFDVAVIGAGLAGLVCAKQLQKKGLRVVVLEKSRGVGGRVATRRWENTCFDHGLRYLENQGDLTQALIAELENEKIIQLWQASVYEFTTHKGLEKLSRKRYVAPQGMTAIAKFFAQDLDIRFQSRVVGLSYQTGDLNWQLTLETQAEKSSQLQAQKVVMAIPAPQAFSLLQESSIEELPSSFLAKLKEIDYTPCITVVAGYNQSFQEDWQGVIFRDHQDLAWICLDSSKRINSSENIFVLQSAGNFAQKYLDTENLETPGKELLEKAGAVLLSVLNKPQWMVTHRWRYSFPHRCLGATYLETNIPLPLICCGDWCEGNLVEGALTSGLATASALTS